MRIQGIAGAKHPTLRKGDVIEMSPEEKVSSMAREMVASNSPLGMKHIPDKAEVVGKVTIVEGRKSVKKSDATQYMAEVRVYFRKLRLSDDRLFPRESRLVKIHCKDCKNDHGLPDLDPIRFDYLAAN